MICTLGIALRKACSSKSGSEDDVLGFSFCAEITTVTILVVVVTLIAAQVGSNGTSLGRGAKTQRDGLESFWAQAADWSRVWVLSDDFLQCWRLCGSSYCSAEDIWSDMWTTARNTWPSTALMPEALGDNQLLTWRVTRWKTPCKLHIRGDAMLWRVRRVLRFAFFASHSLHSLHIFSSILYSYLSFLIVSYHFLSVLI